MKPRVLVVDDSVTIRAVVRGILERNGFEVAVAADGQQAFELLDQGMFLPELVLVDFVMPRMNGFQLCRALRGDERFAGLPVILMSAKSDKIRDQFVEQTGAIDAISKPFDAQALVTVVEHGLERVRNGLRPSRSAMPASLREPPPDTMGASNADSLQGDVREFSIGAVLQLIQMEQKTGVMSVARGPSRIILEFTDGLIDSVESRHAGDEFRLGRVLVDCGFITPGDLQAFLSTHRSDPSVADGESPVASERLAPNSATRPNHETESKVDGNEGVDVGQNLHRGVMLGDRLVQSGRISAEQLRHALERQASELTYEVLRWNDGAFSFQAGPRSENASTTKLELPVAHLVMEGFRRVDEWRLIEAKVGHFDGVLLREASSALGVEDLAMTDTELRVLSLIDGQRTLREVVSASSMSSFDACRVVYQLLEARLIRRKS